MLSDYVWGTVSWLYDNRNIALVVLAVIVLVLSIVFNMVNHIVLLAMVYVEILFALYIGEYQINPALEFYTFPTIISAYMFGGVFAFWFGAALLFLHYLVSQSLGPYLVYILPTFALSALVAGAALEGVWFGGSLPTIGIVVCVIYNAVTTIIGAMLDNDLFEETFWSIVNIAINSILLLKVAPLILAVL